MRRLALITLLVAAPLAAQGTIDPGMSKSQVIAKLGKPTSEHTTGTTTYLYYKNGQEKEVGMSDMVALENDKVVDAIFRARDRMYSGKSSSPAPVARDAAISKGGGKPKSERPSVRAPETAHKAAPPMKKAPETKKAAAPETKKAPATDTKKAPPPPPATKKAPDTTKKAAPPPTKKP